LPGSSQRFAVLLCDTLERINLSVVGIVGALLDALMNTSSQVSTSAIAPNDMVSIGPAFPMLLRPSPERRGRFFCRREAHRCLALWAGPLTENPSHAEHGYGTDVWTCFVPRAGGTSARTINQPVAVDG
jgi:hypothetical protein